MTEKEIFSELVKVFAQMPDWWVLWQAPHYKRMRWDIFTIFDVVAVSSKGAVRFIQITTTPNLSARRKKIQRWFDDNRMEVPDAYIWAWDKKYSVFKIEAQTWRRQRDSFGVE